jgi:hypothetical protein
MPTTETKTPYGSIFRSGDREWFAGSETEFQAAKNFEYFSNPETADKSTLAIEAALAAERDEDEARAIALPEAARIGGWQSGWTACRENCPRVYTR